MGPGHTTEVKFEVTQTWDLMSSSEDSISNFVEITLFFSYVHGDYQTQKIARSFKKIWGIVSPM